MKDKYPQVIAEDEQGKLIQYSRGCVSWVPNEKPQQEEKEAA